MQTQSRRNKKRTPLQQSRVHKVSRKAQNGARKIRKPRVYSEMKQILNLKKMDCEQTKIVTKGRGSRHFTTPNNESLRYVHEQENIKPQINYNVGIPSGLVLIPFFFPFLFLLFISGVSSEDFIFIVRFLIKLFLFL